MACWELGAGILLHLADCQLEVVDVAMLLDIVSLQGMSSAMQGCLACQLTSLMQVDWVVPLPLASWWDCLWFCLVGDCKSVMPGILMAMQYVLSAYVS